jgi:mono/diheme cytochrome c family protein
VVYTENTAVEKGRSVTSVHVRVLCGGALLLGMVAITLAESRTTWDGVYSEAQAKRGAAIYAEQCASCHAPDLSGMDQAPALTGADFLTEWNDLSMNDLFERTRISMPADKPGSLERQLVADVLALLLERNGFPAGQTDLPPAADYLKAARILAKKP